MGQTVIVFQEDCILTAAGREGKYPALTEADRFDLQGQGDSFDRWRQALEKLAARHNPEQVRLVLPAGLCVTRVLQLPYGKGKQLAEMAAREVRENFRNEITDYSIVRQENKIGVDICAGGAEQGNLERFLHICEETGLRVNGITVPLEGYLKIMQHLEHFHKRTGIYLFFEAGSMISILCQKGQYLYSSRTRLFSEPGTLDYGTEIVRSISGILQFYAGRSQEEPITEVCYGGCPDEDFEVSVEGIRTLNLNVSPMVIDRKISVPGREKASDWIPCIGALIRSTRKEKQIDLMNAGRKSEEQGGQWDIGRHLVMPGVVFLTCAILTGGIAAANRIVSAKNLTKQEWIDRVRREGTYQKAQELESQLMAVENGIVSVELLNQNLSSYPEFSGGVLRTIEGVGGSQIGLLITDYDVETGTLTFDANSLAVIDVSGYILRLQETGLFHTVDYTGYTFEDGWYTLSLSCTMEGKVYGGGAQ